jgi:hypothetical protein
VVWVLHTEPGSGDVFDPALGHVRLMGELRRLDAEPLLHKTSHNAFTTTNLQQLLTEHGVRELTVCGIRTEQCVETTARVASDFGYQVTFVVDATATNPIPHRDAPADRSVAELLADPRTLSAEEVIRRTEYALAGRFATIATVGQLEEAAERTGVERTEAEGSGTGVERTEAERSGTGAERSAVASGAPAGTAAGGSPA